VSAVLSSDTWKDLCERLVQTIRTCVNLQNVEPTAFFTHATPWAEKTLELDTTEGPRLLAQNRLSFSLALKVPGGYEPEAVAMHIGRFHSFAEHVQQASDRALGDQSHDLCCRPEVQRALGNPETRLVVAEQVRTARKYLQNHAVGYDLDAGEYQLPLSFAIKHAHVLAEVPAPLAVTFPGYRTSVDLEAGPLTLCYTLDDAELANTLRPIFFGLVAEARASVKTSTLAWLEDLQEQRTTSMRESSSM
jgi:hypothetical protein